MNRPFIDQYADQEYEYLGNSLWLHKSTNTVYFSDESYDFHGPYKDHEEGMSKLMEYSRWLHG